MTVLMLSIFSQMKYQYVGVRACVRACVRGKINNVNSGENKII